MSVSPVFYVDAQHWQLQRVMEECKEKLVEYEKYVAAATSDEEKTKFLSDPKQIYYPDWDFATMTQLATPKTRDEGVAEMWGRELDKYEESRQRKIARVRDAEAAYMAELDFIKNHVEITGEDVRFLNVAQTLSFAGIEGFYKIEKVSIIYKAHTIEAYEMTLARVLRDEDVHNIGYTYVVPKCALPIKGIGVSYITPRTEMF